MFLIKVVLIFLRWSFENFLIKNILICYLMKLLFMILIFLFIDFFFNGEGIKMFFYILVNDLKYELF